MTRTVPALRLLLTMVVALTITGPGTAQSQTRVQPAVPSPEAMVILIRTTLIALSQANQTGNYTVFRELGAPAFRAANSSARLAVIFTSLRNKRADLSAVTVLGPKLTSKPNIDVAGRLNLKGYFPSKPAQLQFNLIYEPVAGSWRLYGIAADVVVPRPQKTVTGKPVKSRTKKSRSTKNRQRN